MYLENSLVLGEGMEKRFEEMGKGKGLTNEQRLSAFNANVSCIPTLFDLSTVMHHSRNFGHMLTEPFRR